MDTVYWILIAVLFAGGLAGLVVPVIPSVLLTLGGMLLYGVLFSFEPFGWFFWTVQLLFTALLFIADYAANLYGVKRFGGTKAGIWGSTVGLLAGPFIIPFAGILIGPFIGAVIAEMAVHRTSLGKAAKIGAGSVAGFIGSTAVKGAIQIGMIAYFLFTVL